MNRFILLTGVLAMTSAVQGDWTPPENPDPSAILTEAQADTRTGRYEDALAKHVWYHENALKYDQGQGGVRLSFALSYWKELGEKYPLALEKMEQFRQQAREQVLVGADVFSAFHDFKSLSKTLDKEPEVVELFEQLDRDAPKSAENVYHVAQPALVRAMKYKLCGKYLDADIAISNAGELFKLNLKLSQKPQAGGAHLLDYAHKSYTSEVTTTLALLVVNGEKEKAERLAKEARAVWEDDDFSKAIDDALEGHVPKPWP